MKTSDIFENLLAGKHPEFSPADVKTASDWLSVNHTTTPIENGKFELRRRDNTFGLFRTRDSQMLGWVILDTPTDVCGQEYYPLTNIQILPTYRKTMAAWLLINGVRGMLNLPVIIDNVLFADGQQLLTAMAKRAAMPSVSVLHKDTGQKAPFDPSHLVMDQTTAIVLESGAEFIVVECAYPGGSVTHYPDWLAGMTEDIE